MPDDAQAAGEACRNCGATLVGPFCHACGQSTDDLHRSLPRLTMEVLGSFVDVDSRIWRTLPRLFFNPADLTRDYLAGERMSQTPPLRMFLIVVVLVFLSAAFADRGGQVNYRVVGSPNAVLTASPDAPPRPPGAAPRQMEPVRPTNAFERWLVPRAERAISSPQAFNQTLVEWMQRLAILLLPVGALTMGLMFAFSRRFLMFDHLIFTMHGLAAQGALLSLVMVIGRFAPAVTWLMLLSPVHTFFHMKGTYGLGVFSTLVRMLGLLIGAIAGVLVLMFALFLITVYEVGGR